ncbi:MAG: DUF2147 domain-containing protein [Pseudomonadota bacterium]|nr:DUF2147 domain-containing protein [Pseudomonadota bacterium]
MFLPPVSLPRLRRRPPIRPAYLWWTKDNGSIIKVAPCAAFYCGTLLWLKEPNGSGGAAKTDVFNEDAGKRGRPLIGIEVLIDLAPDENHWQGKAYNPEDGKTYDITFKVTAGGAPGSKEEIRGCILKVLCKSQTFTKAQAIPRLAVRP